MQTIIESAAKDKDKPPARDATPEAAAPAREGKKVPGKKKPAAREGKPAARGNAADRAADTWFAAGDAAPR